MKFQFSLFRPGVEFGKKGEPFGRPVETSSFEAPSNTAALVAARQLYAQTGLKEAGHFNVSRENA